MYVHSGEVGNFLGGTKISAQTRKVFFGNKKLKKNLKLFKKNKYPVNTYKTNILKPFLYLVDEVGE